MFKFLYLKYYLEIRQKSEVKYVYKESSGNFGLLGQLSVEIFNIDVLDEGVPFISRFAIVFVSFSGDSDSDSSWEVSDTLDPKCLVKLGVNSNISGSHHLGDECPDVSDSAGSFLLEGFSVGKPMDVDGGINSGLGQALSLFFFSHNHKFIKY